MADSESRSFPCESPHLTAWLALVPAGNDAVELRVLAPTPRTVGPAAMDGATWLDDDRFVFIQDDHAMWARASSADAPAALVPAEAGCHDQFVTGAPGGGVVVFAHNSGEGYGSLVVVT